MRRWLLAVALLVAALGAHVADDTLDIGSKRFTEAYILAQVIAQTASPHASTQAPAGLGNTAIRRPMRSAPRPDAGRNPACGAPVALLFEDGLEWSSGWSCGGTDAVTLKRHSG